MTQGQKRLKKIKRTEKLKKQGREFKFKLGSEQCKDVNKKIEEIKTNSFLSENTHILIDFFFVSGVYFLVRNKEIVYIGESGCVMTRISQHISEGVKQFDGFKIIKFETMKDRKDMEVYYIDKFRPIYNLQHNKNVILV